MRPMEGLRNHEAALADVATVSMCARYPRDGAFTRAMRHGGIEIAAVDADT
jgi:hypothetical protein